MTDLHLNFLKPLALKAFYAKVAAERPDALLVTGDTAEADTLAGFLGDLAAIAPVYFVLGNHDFYRSTIREVRDRVRGLGARLTWLPPRGPIKLTERVTMIGVDGWADARCGDLASKVQLSDWQLIGDLKNQDVKARIKALQDLGASEGRNLRIALERAPAGVELLVLTHVPPFPEACVYDGKMSDPPWLPWFTCIATGEALLAHARANPGTKMTVLCGHSHGIGTYTPLPNLEVRTGGWPAGVEGYGNPVVQQTFEL